MPGGDYGKWCTHDNMPARLGQLSYVVAGEPQQARQEQYALRLCSVRVAVLERTLERPHGRDYGEDSERYVHRLHLPVSRHDSLSDSRSILVWECPLQMQ